MPTWNMYMQNASSPLMEQMIFFHDHTMIILIMITIVVGYIILNTMVNLLSNSTMLANQEMEFIWTVIPAMILLLIAFPSLRLLYLADESFDPQITIKVVGHQWYWSYEYSDFTNKSMDSFLLPFADDNNFRLLETDNRVTVPMKTQLRFLISSDDVIHAWTIPALGIKVDAVPGRLNQLNTLINRPSILFGQCSEICGANHSFMPIVIESVDIKNFMKMINNMT